MKKNKGFTPLEKTRSISHLTRRGSPMGFTLIETLVAITLLTVAIVAPMSLTAQSLAAAYYARDQITAYHLAQEAIEAMRAIRDGQILQIAQSPSGATIDIFDPAIIPISSEGLDNPFRIDARQLDPTQAITRCSLDPGGVCKPLQTNFILYGYDPSWDDTHFTRTVRVSFVGPDEVRVVVTITWQTGAFKIRTFNISENLYRWISDGASQT
jgi:type II secretory pathway pseudopilin PulG